MMIRSRDNMIGTLTSKFGMTRLLSLSIVDVDLDRIEIGYLRAQRMTVSALGIPVQ
jgi:hypothetical protein